MICMSEFIFINGLMTMTRRTENMFLNVSVTFLKGVTDKPSASLFKMKFRPANMYTECCVCNMKHKKGVVKAVKSSSEGVIVFVDCWAEFSKFAILSAEK